MANQSKDSGLSLAKSLISDALFQEAFTQCQDCFFLKPGNKGGCIPKVLTFSRQSSDETIVSGIHVLGTDAFDHYDTRVSMMKSIGRDLADQNNQLLMAFFISEAWLSYQRLAEDGSRPYLNASDDPDRLECFVIAGQTIDGRFGYAATAFTRDANECIVAVEPQPGGMCLNSIQDHTENQLKEFRASTLTKLFVEYLTVINSRINARKANA